MLELQDLYASYKEGDILKGVSLFVGMGEIVTLLGRNGAGKSTTINSIMGFLPNIRGKILFDGKDICGCKPHDVARLGIGLVPEDRRIFPSLTILENLNIPVTRKRPEGWRLEKIFDYFPRLRERRKNKGFQLSGGEQQMLAIARILRTKTRLILLDEPTEGLAPMLVREIENILIGIKQEKIPVLLVEQNTRFARKVAERHYILAEGEVVYCGTNEEFSQNEPIQKRYLGV
ncbi:MAG: ABC transporter ATP-binding protein [Syntrophorhabdales bacterium]|jgi:branched-chain amino acid transport system ATP-binding protein